MTSLARIERAELADLLATVGPDAPTLCEGWTTRELAAHLVLRERRPDAALGVVLPPVARWTEHVQAGYARRPWPALVELVRGGPPVWSPYRLEPVDRAANLVEFYVHHEDVRRARPGWAPRPADDRREAALWRALRAQARLLYRRSPVGVVLRRPDGAQVVARDGEPRVVLCGAPGELVLHAFGRTAQASVTVEGDEVVLRRFAGAQLGV